MINKVFLMGNVGKDPTIVNANGNEIVSFPLATSIKLNQNNKMVDVTTWHNIKAFGQLSTVIMAHVKKGSLVHIDGRINNGTYKDKTDGKERYFSEVIVERIVFISNKEKESELKLVKE